MYVCHWRRFTWHAKSSSIIYIYVKIVFIFKVELADRFMDILGQVFKRKEWRIWEIDVDRIVIHPWYDENGMKLVNTTSIQNMIMLILKQHTCAFKVISFLIQTYVRKNCF